MIKRFLTIQQIKTSLERGQTLRELFKADAIIFIDKFATDVYKLFQKGQNEKQILQQIKDWNI